MNGLYSTYRFADGRLVKSSPPPWFAIATTNSENWEERFTAAGATKVDEFIGGSHAIETYQASDGSYFTLYWELQNCIADIFVDNIADYLLFRATYVAPLVSLIRASAPAQASSSGSTSGSLWSRMRGD
jgi:hypothetical protein